MTLAACHPDRPVKAFSLCDSCYRREHRSRIRRMAKCHPHCVEKVRGLCANCYRKIREERGPRATCHPDSLKITREGLCQLCADRSRYANNGISIARRKITRKRSKLALYGMTIPEYDALSQRQDEKCAICRRLPEGIKSRLCVDHCHQTGKIRGLLCNECNRAIGLLGDSAQIIQRAADYIKEFVDPKNSGHIGKGCE